VVVVVVVVVSRVVTVWASATPASIGSVALATAPAASSPRITLLRIEPDMSMVLLLILWRFFGHIRVNAGLQSADCDNLSPVSLICRTLACHGSARKEPHP
jgi:hypothetical protein